MSHTVGGAQRNIFIVFGFGKPQCSSLSLFSAKRVQSQRQLYGQCLPCNRRARGGTDVGQECDLVERRILVLPLRGLISRAPQVCPVSSAVLTDNFVLNYCIVLDR